MDTLRMVLDILMGAPRVVRHGVPELALEKSVMLAAATVSFMTFMVPSLTVVYRFSTMVACFGFCLLVLRFGVHGVLSLIGIVFLGMLVYGCFHYPPPMIHSELYVDWDADTDHIVLKGETASFSDAEAELEIEVTLSMPSECVSEWDRAWSRRTFSTVVPVYPMDEGTIWHYNDVYQDLGHLPYEDCMTDGYIYAEARTYTRDVRNWFGAWFATRRYVPLCFQDSHSEGGKKCE